MDDCAICQHAKVQAIDAALTSGRSPNLVRAQYRLARPMLDAHLAHRFASPKATTPQAARKHLSGAEVSSQSASAKALPHDETPEHLSGAELASASAPAEALPARETRKHLSGAPLSYASMITDDPVGVLAEAWAATVDLPKLRRQQLRQIMPDVLADDGLRQVLLAFIDRDMASGEWA